MYRDVGFRVSGKRCRVLGLGYLRLRVLGMGLR